MAWAVRCRGWRSSSSRDRHERELQDHPVPLGELERALDRCRGAVRVAELVPGRSVEQQRVDGRPARVEQPAESRRPPAPARRRSPAPARPRHPAGGLPPARATPRRCASLRRSRSSAPRSASAARAAARVAHQSLRRARSSRARPLGSACSSREHGCSALGGAELRQRLLEPTLSKPHERARSSGAPALSRSSSAGACGRSTRSSQRSASSKRPSHASAAAPRCDGRSDDAMGPPSVCLGDRHRFLAEPQSRRGSASRSRRRPARGGRGTRSPDTAVRCGGRAPAPLRGRGGRRPCAATTARRCRSSSAPRRDGRACAQARRPSGPRTRLRRTASPAAR